MSISFPTSSCDVEIHLVDCSVSKKSWSRLWLLSIILFCVAYIVIKRSKVVLPTTIIFSMVLSLNFSLCLKDSRNTRPDWLPTMAKHSYPLKLAALRTPINSKIKTIDASPLVGSIGKKRGDQYHPTRGWRV